MRTLLVLLLLVIATVPGNAQLGGSRPDPRIVSPAYATNLTVVGRVVDSEGNYAAKYPVTVSVEGVDGQVGKQTTVFTTCYGDFDVYWELADVSDRWTVRLATGGLTFEQAVDVVHRRNDFAIQLDRTIVGPPESDASCYGSWIFSKTRETFAGQLLEPSPPYKGAKGQTLVAKPLNGVLVTPKWVKPDGTVEYPKNPVYTNEQGAYKYSLFTPVGSPPPAGYVLVWFENDPAKVTNVTLGSEPTHYYVVSQPPVKVTPPLHDTPGLAAAAALAALALVAVARRR